MTEHQEATKPKILIVEDEGIIAVDLKSCVEQLGYTVLACIDSGEKALELVEQDPPDLVLMDIVLKGQMDGIEAAALMRSRWGIPVIFITAYPYQEWVERAKLVNPFIYMLKPFQANEVKVNIEIALYTSRVDRERKKAEESLREKQSQLQAILDYSPALISIKDLNGNVILASHNFAVLDAPPLHEFIGKNVFDLFPREVAENMWNNDLAALKSGSPVESEEIVKHQDGSWHTYLTLKFPVYKETEQPFGICAISSDITERKQAEKKILEGKINLHLLTARLSEVEEMERKRIARELHDLVGQNLTALNMNLNIALGLVPEEVKSKIASRLEVAQALLEETTQHIRNLMTQLQPPLLDDFGLVAALHWYGERLMELAGVEVVIEGGEFFPRQAVTIETVVFRIAQEALANVAKHSGSKQATIRLIRMEGEIHLTVEDTGRGFIFKGFQIADQKGGWGLATMKERAMALGGDLLVVSQPGKGTRIELQLPAPSP
jgi:PAS domain S-box-containing protein